jgi:hypothetical protein
MDENIDKFESLGKLMGLSLEREKEIRKLIGRNIKETQDQKTGNFEKSKVVFRLINNNELATKELYFALVIVGYYFCAMEGGPIMVISSKKEDDLLSGNNGNIMYE